MFNGSKSKVLFGDFSPGQLRSTKSYIFKTDDILGEGATSHVFEGRNKKSGDKVAVKVFKNASYERSNAVQEREFNVLLKIKHENIVQLLAIENDQISKQRIIIMEVCDCSVLNMLDQPRYVYGFPETQFLEVLKDTTAGMKYLQEEGIVHRDIKPGNIMRIIGEDGQATYKLADFGAARELQNDENFVSLYGTEEYLHPAMFGRALLRQPLLTPFTATVDLWSLGVTLYHIATGILPFRPFGGRRNRKTMHKITTQKASGVISGVQKESEDGPITWSTELPKHCHISSGLKQPLTEMLAGLLECNTENMWSFETYFNTANSIVSMRVVDVLNVPTSQLMKIYVDPNATYAEFQEHVALQTNIAADQQLFIHDDAPFHPDLSVCCTDYPETSADCPVMMIPKLFDGSSSPIPPDCPAMPAIRTDYLLERDYPYARLCTAVMYFLQWKQQQLFTLNKTNAKVTKAVSTITKQQILQLSLHLSEVTVYKEITEGALQCRTDKLDTMIELLDAYLVVANGSRLDGERIRQELTDIQTAVTRAKDTNNMMVSKWTSAQALLEQLHAHDTGSNRVDSLMKGCGCKPKDRCRERLCVLLEDTKKIMTQFRRDGKVKQLPYNEEQIHKIDKIKLNEKSMQATTLINEHCVKRWRESHSELMTWFSDMAPIQQVIHTLDSELAYLVAEYPKLQQDVLAKSSQWAARIADATAQLALLLKKPQSPRVIPSPSSNGDHPLNNSAMPEPIRICYPPESRPDDSDATPSPPRSPPSDSSKQGGMVIAVPKSLKRNVEAHLSQQSDISSTAKEVTDSQRLMKEMQDELSLGIPDQPDFNLPNHIDQ
ncbi:serine/threonine-protein kinase TBK1-like [Amphiura filiformis]|uniref:serine/threonine-protein kinase TBK1-like n=1 Tax=Amphiura filiformis TaxID=82378 RepID=UPI003B20BCFF